MHASQQQQQQNKYGNDTQASHPHISSTAASGLDQSQRSRDFRKHHQQQQRFGSSMTSSSRDSLVGVSEAAKSTASLASMQSVTSSTSSFSQQQQQQQMSPRSLHTQLNSQLQKQLARNAQPTPASPPASPAPPVPPVRSNSRHQSLRKKKEKGGNSIEEQVTRVILRQAHQANMAANLEKSQSVS